MAKISFLGSITVWSDFLQSFEGSIETSTQKVGKVNKADHIAGLDGRRVIISDAHLGNL